MCNLLHPSDHYTQLLCTADAVYVNQWRPGQEIIKKVLTLTSFWFDSIFHLSADIWLTKNEK